MLSISGKAATAGIGIGLAAVGFASPAYADDFDGTYTVNGGGAYAGTWVITSCGTDSFIPCAHVSQSGGVNQPWLGDAQLSVGYWTIFADRPDAIVCPDGSTHPGQATYSWNAATLSGSVSVYSNGECGSPPKTLAAPITLTRTAVEGSAGQ